MAQREWPRGFMHVGQILGQAWRWCPVHYVVFDLLYQGGRCLLDEPLARRRALLAELCTALGVPSVQFSAGEVGGGGRSMRRC
jgi:ATP-dependent DNA ligase